MSDPIRVMIADDHPMTRVGLAQTLQAHNEYSVVAETEFGEDVEQLVREHQPDIAILDVRLKGRKNGLDVIKDVRTAKPDIKIIVFTNYINDPYVRVALEHGVQAFLLKDTAANEIVNAIRVVMAGHSVYSEAVSETIVAGYLNKGTYRRLSLDALTPREKDVLSLLAQGKTNEEIASDLQFSVKSIQGYLTSLYEKLGARNRTEAVINAARDGLVVIPGTE